MLENTVCAIDMGSNAIRACIVKASAGSREIVWRERYPVRLGAGAFGKGEFSDGEIAEVANVFREIGRHVADCSCGRVRAIATSAMRDSRNARQLIVHVQAETGIGIEVVDADEEANLMVLGVAAELPGTGECLLMDVGGGSTEIMRIGFDRQVTFARSLQLGAVRLREKFGENAIVSYRMAARESLGEAMLEQLPGGLFAVGVGGGVTSLLGLKAAIQGNPDAVITENQLQDIISTIENLGSRDIEARFNVGPDRADIILAGAVIVQEAMSIYGISTLHVSRAGVADGLVEKMIRELETTG